MLTYMQTPTRTCNVKPNAKKKYPKKDHTSGFTCFSPTTNSVYFTLLPALLDNPSCGTFCHLNYTSMFLASSDCAENISFMMCSGTSTIKIYSRLQKSRVFTSTTLGNQTLRINREEIWTLCCFHSLSSKCKAKFSLRTQKQNRLLLST